MRCRIYRPDGRLVHDGPCGIRRDGAIEVVAERATTELGRTRGLLLLEEGPRRYPVRVTAEHAPANRSLHEFTVFHLTAIDEEVVLPVPHRTDAWR
jgi:hypothetical protein